MAERRIVDIGPFLEDLKKELKDLEGSTEALTVEEAAEDEIEDLKKLPVIDPERMIPAWRDPDKDPPTVETEVLILYRCNGYEKEDGSRPPLPEVRQHLPGPRETLWLRNALVCCLAWQPARRCMYRVRPLQAHGDCLEQGVEEEKCTMMGS